MPSDDVRKTFKFADDDDSDDLGGGFGRGKRSYDDDDDEENGGWAINEDHSDRLWDSADDVDDDDEDAVATGDADDVEDEEEEENLFGAPKARPQPIARSSFWPAPVQPRKHRQS